MNPLLYTLLAQWGFNGHVTSDCGSVDDLSRTYQRGDPAEVNALTLRAGMNVRCGNESAALAEAVRRGLASEAELDYRLAALLRTMFRLGFFDPRDRVPFNRIAPAENDTPEHGALALQAARESLVLLKNDGLLPLRPDRLRRVAVIGPNATSVPVLVGNYNGSPSAPVTILAGLQAALAPAGVEVDYAHGCDYAARPSTVRLLSGGWFDGEFFSNPDLAGPPAFRRTERPLRFDFGAPRVPFPGRPHELPDAGISARWSGDLTTTLAGDYQLVVRGRGGFRLKLAGETIIDSWTPPAGEEGRDREVSVMRRLADNASLPLTLEYRQGAGPVKVELDWNTPAPESGMAEALAAAAKADVIIFVGGISAQLEGEEMMVDYEGFVGGDRVRIELPGLQQELLEQLRATGKPLVFVNLSGSAIAMPWADAHVNAIVQAWYPGQATGTAVADVLLGHYNPAGRLPVTFYRATTDLPGFEDYAMAGRTYRYFAGKPLYAFGHGLSYTKFDYSRLACAPQADGSLRVTVTVANTGGRDGDEVVQLYATPPAAREREALCGFSRVFLKQGESRAVTITVPATALRRWDPAKHAYAQPAGEWTLAVGAASDDLRVSLQAQLH
jgi:beta-glucosidase